MEYEKYEDENFNLGAYLPLTEAAIQSVAQNSGLGWVLEISEETFAFGDPSWDSDSFESFVAGTYSLALDNDVDITAMVRGLNCMMDVTGNTMGMLCDFNYLNLADYITTADSLNTAFMATSWYESAMADPFYVLTTPQIDETVKILTANGITVTAEEISAWQAQSQ